MKNVKRIIALLIAAAMVFALAACGAEGNDKPTESKGNEATQDGEGEATVPAPEELDTSKQVEVVMYFISNRPAGQDIVDEAINKYLLEKLNCTLSINWINWSDYANTYNMLLSSGEEIDLIYTAGWLNFNDLAQRGAFKALDELWPKYAPKNYAKATEQAKLQATVNGNIYCIPTLWATYIGQGPIWRTDIIAGSELEGIVLDSWDKIEQYMEFCVAEHPEVSPLNIYNNGSPVDSMWARSYGYKEFGPFLFDPTEENPKLFTYYEMESVNEFLEMMKRWNEKGFFSKSCLADTDSTKLDNGKAYITFHNVDSYQGQQTKYNTGTSEFQWQFYDIDKYSAHLPFTQDSISVPAMSKNPERALAVWDLLTSDQEAYDLFYYGIEGTTYKLLDGGVVEMLDPDLYGQSGCWPARTTGLTRDSLGNPQEWHDWHAYWEEEIAKDDTWEKYSAIVVNTTGLDTEVSNINNVIQTYWWPLELGLNANGIEGGLAEFKTQMEAAGIETLREAYQAQLDEYVASLNQ
mgnify:CR=1 FL=1